MTEEQRQAEMTVLRALKNTYLDEAEAILAKRDLVVEGSNPPTASITYGGLTVTTDDEDLIEDGRAALETQFNTELDTLLTAAQTYRQTPP